MITAQAIIADTEEEMMITRAITMIHMTHTTNTESPTLMENTILTTIMEEITTDDTMESTTMTTTVTDTITEDTTDTKKLTFKIIA